MLIQGIPSEGSESEGEEEEEGKGPSYTAEQIATLRHIIITQRRADALEKMETVVLGKQSGDTIRMFNTSFSYEIFQKIPPVIRKIAKKNPPAQFDDLFALTSNLHEYDVWMMDYEDSDMLKRLLTQLGNAWKKLLAMSDEQLGIDSEFTRPGVTRLLEKFAETARNNPEQMRFKFK